MELLTLITPPLFYGWVCSPLPLLFFIFLFILNILAMSVLKNLFAALNEELATQPTTSTSQQAPAPQDADDQFVISGQAMAAIRALTDTNLGWYSTGIVFRDEDDFKANWRKCSIAAQAVPAMRLQSGKVKRGVISYSKGQVTQVGDKGKVKVGDLIVKPTSKNTAPTPTEGQELKYQLTSFESGQIDIVKPAKGGFQFRLFSQDARFALYSDVISSKEL